MVSTKPQEEERVLSSFCQAPTPIEKKEQMPSVLYSHTKQDICGTLGEGEIETGHDLKH